MIYLREKSFKRQVDLLDFFCNQGEFDLIIWFFPEPVLSNICDLELAPKDIIQGEQVTFYGDAINPMKTVRVRLTKDLISKIRASANQIRQNCDCLALYRTGETNWVACTIGHERMCLVRDRDLINDLSFEGFNASLNKPEWW